MQNVCLPARSRDYSLALEIARYELKRIHIDSTWLEWRESDYWNTKGGFGTNCLFIVFICVGVLVMSFFYWESCVFWVPAMERCWKSFSPLHVGFSSRDVLYVIICLIWIVAVSCVRSERQVIFTHLVVTSIIVSSVITYRKSGQSSNWKQMSRMMWLPSSIYSMYWMWYEGIHFQFAYCMDW